MGVGGIRGGKGRVGGTSATSRSESAQKTSGSSFKGKAEKARASDPGPRAAALRPAASADPIASRAVEIARKLHTGEISSREEATKQLIADILQAKLHIQPNELTSRIADALVDDPRLNEALKRLWSSEG